MVFSSVTFLFYFLPSVLLVYYLSPYKYRNLVLFLSSLLFYFWGEKTLAIILLISIIFNYYYAKLIDYKRSPLILGIGVGVNLLALGCFKYMDFFIKNINNIFGMNIPLLKIILPIGISFFTFQAISYLVDVYRKDVKASDSLINFGAYLSFFPQLIAGPIVRYQTIEQELQNRKENVDDFYLGTRRFIVGLFKKIVIANMLGAVIKDLVIDTGITSLMYMIGSSLQLYYDFSAYSDMAIGMGKMFGFHFNENFDHPLVATSITDFWRRWHMSLSSFFKDYVYIPLGGSRSGNLFVNIMVVWFLTGMWHGADYNFMLWGLSFGIVLLIEKYYLLGFFKKHRIIGFIYTFTIVNILFVVFNNSDLNVAKDIILTIFNKPFMNEVAWYHFSSNLILFIIAIIGMSGILNKLYLKLQAYQLKYINSLEVVVVMIMLMISISYLLDAGFNPFLYFRF